MRKCIYIYKCGLSASARHTACVGLMWAQRRRHWSGIGPALDRVSRLMLSGVANVTVHKHYIRILGSPRDSIIFIGGRKACYTLPPPPSHLQLTIDNR